MKLVESPNRWSCLPASFAMALGISFSEMIARIGHDGSEIIWPELPEPQKRRTFHLQECLIVALNLGFVTVELQFHPCLTPDGQRIYDVPCAASLCKLMSVSKGVLLGKGRSHGHAVAWSGEHVFDPHGIVYDIENQDMFTPMSYFLISNQILKFDFKI